MREARTASHARVDGQAGLLVTLRLLALGWGLLAVSAIGSGSLGDAGWAAAVIGVLVLALTLPRSTHVAGLLQAAVGLYALGLAMLTIAASAGLIAGMSNGRVELFTANPNLLAAGLVVSYASWSVVAPGRRWVWWGWPVVLVAVLQTGSRTALVAALVALSIWLIAAYARQGRRIAYVLSIALLASVGGAVAAWQLLVVERTVNLVTSPNDFRHPSWSFAEGATVTVVLDATPGPFAGTQAQRIVAQAVPESDRVVALPVGLARLDVPYVASLFLRSDEPQRLVLRE